MDNFPAERFYLPRNTIKTGKIKQTSLFHSLSRAPSRTLLRWTWINKHADSSSYELREKQPAWTLEKKKLRDTLNFVFIYSCKTDHVIKWNIVKGLRLKNWWRIKLKMYSMISFFSKNQIDSTKLIQLNWKIIKKWTKLQQIIQVLIDWFTFSFWFGSFFYSKPRQESMNPFKKRFKFPAICQRELWTLKV